MPIETLILVGGGGHAKVVLDALLCNDAFRGEITLRDDDPAREGTSILGYVIATPAVPDRVGGFHVAIGNNGVRARLSASCRSIGGLPLRIVHSRAVVAASAEVADGCFVAAGALIAADAKVEEGTIVNHGAIVDHDCRVGRFSHIGPNATLGGGVAVGSSVLIGAGATVLPGICIGDDVTVGAGAVVLSNVSAGQIMAGVPAKNIGHSQS